MTYFDPKIDYTEFTHSKHVEEFLNKIDDWKELNHIVESSPLEEDVREYMNIPFSKIKTMGYTETLHAAYVLHSYANHLANVLGREQAVLEWADHSIYHIVASKVENYKSPDGYTKWEQKYYSAVKENPLANELFKLKMHCLTRVKSVEKTISSVEKMAQTLEQIARNK